MRPRSVADARGGGEAATAGARWTPADIDALGVCVDVVTAGSVIGVGRSKAYELARADQFPVPVHRLGRKMLVVVADLRGFLGLEPTGRATPSARRSDAGPTLRSIGGPSEDAA